MILFQTTLGVTKVPLTYVTREVEAAEPIANNPLAPQRQGQRPFGEKYSMFYDEMTARTSTAGTSHDHLSFAADNRTILELMVKSFKEHDLSLM
jgi:hypothetical protein